MQLPQRWKIADETGEVDAWIERFDPTEAQRYLLYHYMADTLAVNPLNFPRAVGPDAMENEHVATVPGSRIVVSFLLDRSRRELVITRVTTR